MLEDANKKILFLKNQSNIWTREPEKCEKLNIAFTFFSTSEEKAFWMVEKNPPKKSRVEKLAGKVWKWKMMEKLGKEEKTQM